MANRLLFININVIQSIERMKLVELVLLITMMSLLLFLPGFKSLEMKKLDGEASECNWNVSASCPEPASPPVFLFGMFNVLLEANPCQATVTLHCCTKTMGLVKQEFHRV